MNSSCSGGSSRLSSVAFIRCSPGAKPASIAAPSAVRRSARWRRGSTSRRIQPLVSNRAAMSAVVELSSATARASVTWSMPGQSCKVRKTAYCTGVTSRPSASANIATAICWARRIRWPGWASRSVAGASAAMLAWLQPSGLASCCALRNAPLSRPGGLTAAIATVRAPRPEKPRAAPAPTGARHPAREAGRRQWRRPSPGPSPRSSPRLGCRQPPAPGR